MNKTHVVSRDGPKKEPNIVRQGDTLKIVDEIPIDVRVALSEAARLGKASILDAEASLLEHLAGAKRKQHAARVLLDANPHIMPVLPEPRRPWLNFAMVALSIVTLVLVASIASRAPHPTPLEEVRKTPPEVAQNPPPSPSRQKGRARP